MEVSPCGGGTLKCGRSPNTQEYKSVWVIFHDSGVGRQKKEIKDVGTWKDQRDHAVRMISLGPIEVSGLAVSVHRFQS